MHAGVILACGNGTFDPLPEGGTACSPSDEYDVGIPFTLQGEEQKSAVHLVACAECRCSARNREAGSSTPSRGWRMRRFRIGPDVDRTEGIAES